MNTIAIVDDDRNVRETVQKWIDASPEYRCICTCATGKEAMASIPALRPDVVLMDIRLPGESGITCTARLKQRIPALQVIMMTVYNDHDLIFGALKAGASGYLLKRATREELLRAITEVLAGGAPMTGEIARRVVQTFQVPLQSPEKNVNLSAREEEVLAELCRGFGNKEIAAHLGISYDTVCVHLRHIYEKLHVRGRSEAIIMCLGNGASGHGGDEPAIEELLKIPKAIAPKKASLQKHFDVRPSPEAQ